MEQKDYILREIEKIGTIIQYIRQKLFGGNTAQTNNSEISVDDITQVVKNELNFDIQKLDSLNDDELEKYLLNFKGFNTENIENLANLLYYVADNKDIEDKKPYFRKSLRLYEFVNKKTKTFSLQRENIISELKGKF